MLRLPGWTFKYSQHTSVHLCNHQHTCSNRIRSTRSSNNNIRNNNNHNGKNYNNILSSTYTTNLRRLVLGLASQATLRSTRHEHSKCSRQCKCS